MRVALLQPMTDHFVRRVLAACERNSWTLVLASSQPQRWTGLVNRAPHQVLAVPSLGAPLDTTADALREAHVDCVVPGGEFSTVRADEVAAALGLPGGDPERMRGLRNKADMRALFDEHGVPQPRVLARLDVAVSTELAALRLPFPVVVKPVDMAGSMFVRICDDPAEVAAVLRDMSTVTASTSTGLPFAGEALVEQIAEGPEYSCEVVVEGGVSVATLVTTKYLSPLPDCNEVGHLTGDSFDDVTGAEVDEAVAAVVRSSGLQSGVFHVEFRLTTSGPQIIEAAARVAGDRIAEISELRHGWSLEEALVRARAGLPVAPAQHGSADPTAYYGVAFTFSSDDTEPPAGVDVLWRDAAPLTAAPVDGTRVEDRTGTLICRSVERAPLDAYLSRWGNLRR